jgi:hypothetical protein
MPPDDGTAKVFKFPNASTPKANDGAAEVIAVNLAVDAVKELLHTNTSYVHVLLPNTIFVRVSSRGRDRPWGGCACRALVLKPHKSRPDMVAQSAEMSDDELAADVHRHGLASDNVSLTASAENTLNSRGSR